MPNRRDEDVQTLERAHGERWQVWVVERVYGGPVWCARRWDGTGTTINADSPGHLSDDIGRAEAGQGAGK